MNNEINVNKPQMSVREQNDLIRVGRPTARERLNELWNLFLPGIIACLIFTTVLAGSFVSGHSMEPTLRDKQIVIALRVGYTLQHGDLITFKSTIPGPHEQWLKRVIGLPGDVLQFDEENQVIYRNGEVLHEPYLAAGEIVDSIDISTEPFTIPDGYLFVMGDNRQHSTDSRSAYVGFIPMDSVVGKVLGYGCSDANDR